MTELPLEFFPTAEEPKKDAWPYDPYLLYNQCDGYHVVYAHWDEDGAFEGFFDFLGTCRYERDFYQAWAKLPDCNEALFPIFGRRGPASPSPIAPTPTKEIP